MNKYLGLIITPFDAGAVPVTETIKKALNESGFIPVTIDRMTIPGALVGETILDAITRADLIVVDISRQSPNAMYELGFAHALRKPTMLIVNRAAALRIPADIAGHLYMTYDEDNLTSLRDSIIRFAPQMISKRTEGRQA